MRSYGLIFALLFISCAASAQKKLDSKSPVAQAIDEFLKDLPPEDAWGSWVVDHGPVYGNYCGAGHGDASYEEPCLSRLDCICKAHDFGYSLRRYLEADRIFVKEILEKPLVAPNANPDYETFLQLMTATLFAGKLAGQDLVKKIKDANATWETDPKKATQSLDSLIDQNAVFKKKIEEINQERLKYEEEAQRSPEIIERHLAIATQPLSLFAGLVSLGFEWKMFKQASLRLGVGFLGAGLITDTYLGYGNNNNLSAFGSTSVKIHYLGESLQSGLYFEPSVDFGYESIVRNQGIIRDYAFVPALYLGADKIFFSGLQIDIGVGAGYHLGIPVGDIPPDFRIHFVVPKFRASVGWAW